MAKWVRWSHKWHDKIKSGFYDKLASEGKLGPSDVQPNVEPFSFYLDAFFELRTCRQMDGPIPFTSIVEYFRIYGGEEDFDEFLYVVRAMDNAELDELSKKHKEVKNVPGNAGKKNPR